MGNASDFYTRDGSNEGVKIPLKNPKTGKKEWIKIRGVDSDIFRAAKLVHDREHLKIAKLKTDKEKSAATKEARLELLSELVIGWSFPEFCDPAGIMELLENAPVIADLIDTMATVDKLFVQKKSKTSKSTPLRNLNSQKSQKAKK